MFHSCFGGGQAQLQKQLFNLKFTAKQLNRMQAKAEKQEQAELAKVKKAMEKGDAETARIYAQNAIRIKNTSNGYLRLAIRLDVFASRLESAMKMKQVTKEMGSVCKGMDKILSSMDMEKISATMDKFEASFDRVEMVSQYVEGAMNGATSSTMPEDDVDRLLAQVSDEHGLEFKSRAADVSNTQVALPVGTDDVEEGLEKRLAALRG